MSASLSAESAEPERLRSEDVGAARTLRRPSKGEPGERDTARTVGRMHRLPLTCEGEAQARGARQPLRVFTLRVTAQSARLARLMSQNHDQETVRRQKASEIGHGASA